MAESTGQTGNETPVKETLFERIWNRYDNGKLPIGGAYFFASMIGVPAALLIVGFFWTGTRPFAHEYVGRLEIATCFLTSWMVLLMIWRSERRIAREDQQADAPKAKQWAFYLASIVLFISIGTIARVIRDVLS